MINIKEDEKLSVLNHSCAHLLAQAVKHLYKDAKFWVGPVIKEGFYYDIDLGDIKLNDDDLVKIEKEMKKISKDGKKILYANIVMLINAVHDKNLKLDDLEGDLVLLYKSKRRI